MNRLGKLFPAVIAALVFGFAGTTCADTPNTPVIDGVISESAADWDVDERIIEESMFDSYWERRGEIGDLYLTWDETSLYIGCRYSIFENSLLLCLEAGTSREDDGAQNLQDLDWYPRNISFLTMYPEYLAALWNADLSTGGVRRLYHDESSGRYATEPVSYSWAGSAESGETGDLELSVSWETLYPESGGTIPDGAELKIVGIVCGADNSTGGDAAPDNPYVSMGNIMAYFRIDPDSDPAGTVGHGFPDPDVSPSAAGNVISFSDIEFIMHSVSLSPSCLTPGNGELTVRVRCTSSVFFRLTTTVYNDRGEQVQTGSRLVTPQETDPPEPETHEIEIRLSPEKLRPGIHFCRVEIGSYKAETLSFIVAR